MSYITPGSNNAFAPLDSVSSVGGYAEGVGAMQPLQSNSQPYAVIGGYAFLVLTNSFSVTATVTTPPTEGAALTLTGVYEISAFSGARLAAALPPLSLTATGTVAAVGRLQAALPSLELDASVSVGGVASAELVLAGTFAVESYSGARAELSTQLNGYVVSSSGLTGATASAVLGLLDRLVVTASVTAEGLATAVLILPALQAAPQGQAWLVAPSLTVTASGGPIVSVTYEAYAINLTTGAVTHYTNYPFDNIVRFGANYYAVSPTGIFKLGGSLDLTAPIAAHIKTFSTTFSDRKMKRLPYVYSSGRSDGGVTVGVTADEGATYEYTSQWGAVAGSTNHRTVVGKGIRGVYYALDIKNIDGSSLAIDGIDAIVESTERAI